MSKSIDELLGNYEGSQYNNNNNGKKKNFNKNQNQNGYQNPLNDLYRYNKIYDRDEMLNILIKKECLIKMINDIKRYKTNKDNRYPSYVNNAISDIIFASALPEAINKVFGKDKKFKESNLDVSKKDLDYLMGEILIFLNNKHEQSKVVDKYDEDSLESMMKAYTNILYKINKKKIRKFNDIEGIPESLVKKIVVLTSGKNIQTSFYILLNYLYKVSDDKSFKLTKKRLIKIFKASYGDDCMPEVAKYLMLERKRGYDMTKSEEDLWCNLDELMRDTLESLKKPEIEKILKCYAKTRKAQETKNKIPRRLGDRRSIHSEDYKKLTKVFDELEEKDFSLTPYFR